MLFTWLKNRRRRKIRSRPFPPEWLEVLHENVIHYGWLSRPEQAKLSDDLRIFLAEKSLEGCRGLEMTDEIRVTVAAQACVLILGLDIDYFRRVQSVLVYPSGFRAPHSQRLGEEMILEGEEELLGQAHYRGPVILSWDQVLDAGRNPGKGENLVFHEFAHQLDMLNDAADGIPLLHSEVQEQEWQTVMAGEFHKLRRRADAGRETFLDPYGATDEAEFFAVVSEAFFDAPLDLHLHHPRLYDLFSDFYRQDPAGRFSR